MSEPLPTDAERAASFRRRVEEIDRERRGLSMNGRDMGRRNRLNMEEDYCLQQIAELTRDL